MINPTDEEIFEKEPLMKFSFYLSGRNNVLLNLADEIENLLNESFVPKIIPMNKLERAETLMWLWTLGAYEVIRTMVQAKACFSCECFTKLFSLKKELAKIRMPSSKMEKQGKNKPVNSNRSPSGIDFGNKDILVGDPDEPNSARKILEHYSNTINEITVKDVLKRHEETYKSETLQL